MKDFTQKNSANTSLFIMINMLNDEKKENNVCLGIIIIAYFPLQVKQYNK